MNRFHLWIGLLGLGILLGLWTTFKVYTVGFTVYAKTDVLVWTLPLSTYIFFSLTSAGLAFRLLDDLGEPKRSERDSPKSSSGFNPVRFSKRISDSESVSVESFSGFIYTE